MAFCEGIDFHDVCRHPIDYFWFIPPGDNEEEIPVTNGRNQCWVGMSNTDDFVPSNAPSPRGQACQPGCVSCPDLPAELATSAAPLFGKRWLHPHPEVIPVDANGFVNVIRANHVNLIPRYATNYLLGPCNDSFGEECFGGNVCQCWGLLGGAKNLPGSVESGSCLQSDGIVGHPKGYLPSEFVFTGQHFPPRTIGFGVSVAGGLFCRQFLIQGADDGSTKEDLRVILEGGEMLSPAFVRTGFRNANESIQSCVVNLMVVLVGSVVDSDCAISFSKVHLYSDPPGTKPIWYNSATNRDALDKIRISGNPHFRSIDNRFEGLRPRDHAHLKVKTEAINMAMTRSFPVGGNEQVINFDIIDHRFAYTPGDNSNLNTWGRKWDANDNLILPSELPRITTFPVKGIYKNSRHEVDVDLVMTFVEMKLWYLPQAVRNQLNPNAGIDAEVHARFSIRVEMSILVNEIGGVFTVNQPWMPDEDDRAVEIRYTTNTLDVPTLDPPGFDELLIVDDDGTPIDVPTHAEWLGYLGGVSNGGNPTFPISSSGSPAIIMFDVVDNVFEIPGWPTAHGLTLEDPLGKRDMAQIHGGKVVCSFAG